MKGICITMKHDYSIVYESIRLIPLDSVSSEKYRIIRNQDNNRCFFLNSNIITVEQQMRWYERYLSSEGDYMFAILNENSIIIGGCAIYNIDFIHGVGEFGRIVIDGAYSGRGYGYLALKASIKLASIELGLSNLILEVMSSNKAALRIYEKAGFQKKADKDGIIQMECELNILDKVL